MGNLKYLIKAKESFKENLYEGISGIAQVIFAVMIILYGYIAFISSSILAITVLVCLIVIVSLFLYKLYLRKISLPETLFIALFGIISLTSFKYNKIAAIVLLIFGVVSVLQSLDIVPVEEKFELDISKLFK